MNNNITRIKVIFFLSSITCFTLAAELKDGWWAMSGFGSGLMLWVLYRRNDTL